MASRFPGEGHLHCVLVEHLHARLSTSQGLRPRAESRYGFVELQRHDKTVRPVSKATEFRIVAA